MSLSMFSQLSAALPLAQSSTDFFTGATAWIAFGLIVVVGLFVFGLTDLSRFSLKRAWAISSVCFSESLRRRVLWVTPLAMLGVIVISQLQKPIDEQDAIRATTKFAIFATALVVVITTIILACTNLPREIENRVIYTVVTKPTTRLEIVLGKVIGFARVSLTILLIMGVFSFVYLKVRAWSMERDIAARLEADTVPTILRPTLAHYRDAGLLSAKSLYYPNELQIFARVPEPGEDRFWFKGENEQEVTVQFEIHPEMLIPPGGTEADIGKHPAVIIANVGYEQFNARSGNATDEPEGPVPYAIPFLVPPEARGGLDETREQPSIVISIKDSSGYSIPGLTINNGQPIDVPSAEGTAPVEAVLSPESVKTLYDAVTRDPNITVSIQGPTSDTRYFVSHDPVRLLVLGTQEGGPANVISPVTEEANPDEPVVAIRGRSGTYGQQLGGGTERTTGVAIYRFSDVKVEAGDDGLVPMELRVGIERSGDEVDESQEVPTRLVVTVRNRETGAASEPVTVIPETLRPSFFEVPQEAVAGGDFDVLIRNLTPGHFVGLQAGEDASLKLVQSRQPFLWNLIKSLLILWLMSILVTAIAIFCSTFLSWPIAVVLTLVILLGHWGVMQLEDATQPGIGNAVVTDLFGSSATNAAKARAVSATVEALSGGLRIFSAVLPDISRFTAVQEIEQGIAIPRARLVEAAGVTFGFGIPLIVLAYVFLKNKEVAP